MNDLLALTLLFVFCLLSTLYLKCIEFAGSGGRSD